MERALTRSIRGTIINTHEYGAIARLEDGTLAAIDAAEFARHQPAYVASRNERTLLELYIERTGRHASATLVAAERSIDEVVAQPLSALERAQLPTHTSIAFEMRLGAYLRDTEASAPADRAAPAERHFIRKKRRGELFEARNETTENTT